MLKRSILLLLISMFYSNFAFSQLFDGKTQSMASLEQLVGSVKPGSILILGENHGIPSHRDQHIAILNGLRAKGHKISVGLEFVNYTDQVFVDQYRNGQINDQEFLTSIKWGGFGFEYYKQQLIFPIIELGEKSLGLNLPRTISSKISRQGLASLTEDDLKMMPPNFQLGRDSYKARFMDVAGVHCKVPENCFAAQSSWDDTIAWQAVQFIQQNPDQVLVIVIGEFHVQYGGGTPDRILARLPSANIISLSQIWAEGMTDEEIGLALQPSAVEGPRADFIWVSKP